MQLELRASNVAVWNVRVTGVHNGAWNEAAVGKLTRFPLIQVFLAAHVGGRDPPGMIAKFATARFPAAAKERLGPVVERCTVSEREAQLIGSRRRVVLKRQRINPRDATTAPKRRRKGDARLALEQPQDVGNEGEPAIAREEEDEEQRQQQVMEVDPPATEAPVASRCVVLVVTPACKNITAQLDCSRNL